MTSLVGSDDQRRLRQDLIDAGLLIEMGADGLYGQAGAFLDLRLRLSELLFRMAADEVTDRWHFPALLPLRRMEDVGYLASFPHLAGTVQAFVGGDAEAAALAGLAERHEDWSSYLSATNLALAPAGCHPVYPAVAARGPIPPGGLTVEVGPAPVFRREPAEDPSRWQMFHMHELVRIADPETVLVWREVWLERGLRLLRALALNPAAEQASDPFFGRAGRLLAANQRSQELKFELLVHVTDPVPTALASFNYHRDHFTSVYGLAGRDGREVHTACLGFGLERLVVALLAKHGFDPSGWDPSVRELLWP